MKLLIDTNIIIDVLYARKPFVEDASKLFKCCELKMVDGYVLALSIPNIVYIMRKELGRKRICQLIETLTTIFDIVDLKQADLLKAASMDINDYEDALQCTCAKRINADFIVTRNVRDYTKSAVPAIHPSTLLKML